MYKDSATMISHHSPFCRNQKSFPWCMSLITGVLREVTTHFIVDARGLTKTGGNHVKARIINPSGANTDIYITDKEDGTYKVEYTAYEDGKCC